MTGIKNDKRCFTFTWTLENASYCLQKKGEKIESPVFVVDEIHKTKWKLWLYPRGESNGNFIGCFLHREFASEGEDSVEIKYELAFIGESGLVPTFKSLIQHSFSKIGGRDYGYPKFVKREDVFILKRSTFLPKDTLTARCRIWKNVGEMTENVRCFARTRIGVEKRSFLWNLENFSSFEPEKECAYLIKSLENDSVLMTVNLCLTGGQNCEEMIHFQLTRSDQCIKYCALRLSLIDIHGRRVGCNQDEFWFGKLCNIQRFTFLFSRQMLMVKKSLYLPSDILSLQWECAFSKGIFSEEIEEVQCGCIVPESKFLMLTNEQQ
ncbi:hypothetical protein AVEN_176736-1 [Araneus ventricosus]|uniref:MATH domain-containing protein n=1 Tax=Araneus ventricosus TaxID=182803 RepID=A0A4Y2SLR1_ARAVE|nr:hypothetical protein AVEN_176736-1 [Araneus ventricosus]